MWKETVVGYYKELSRNLTLWTKEPDENSVWTVCVLSEFRKGHLSNTN